jgi:hypothetical protein
MSWVSIFFFSCTDNATVDFISTHAQQSLHCILLQFWSQIDSSTRQSFIKRLLWPFLYVGPTTRERRTSCLLHFSNPSIFTPRSLPLFVLTMYVMKTDESRLIVAAALYWFVLPSAICHHGIDRLNFHPLSINRICLCFLTSAN